VGCYEDHAANSAGAVRLRDRAVDYAKNAKFTVSMWFTHNHCENTNATGQWEPLYHQSGEYCDGCPQHGIDIFIACGITQIVGDQQVRGNWIQFSANDDNGKSATVDVPSASTTSA
jgi:hypothetical protein